MRTRPFTSSPPFPSSARRRASPASPRRRRPPQQRSPRSPPSSRRTPPLAPAASPPAAAEAAAPAGGITIAEDPRFAKFYKMLRMGLPLGAVQQKMSLETGLDVSLLERDPASPAPP